MDRIYRIDMIFSELPGQEPATEGHGALFGCFSIGLADLAKPINVGLAAPVKSASYFTGPDLPR